jgi:transcriptional regulator with XRE-family HTH domain
VCIDPASAHSWPVPVVGLRCCRGARCLPPYLVFVCGGTWCRGVGAHTQASGLLLWLAPAGVIGVGKGGPAPGAQGTVPVVIAVTLGVVPASDGETVTVGVTPLRWGAVTVEVGDLAADRVKVQSLRRSLGAHLALHRVAAGVSQPQLGQALGRTRSMISRIEHGTRGMPEELWKITDQVCRAQGALIAEHATLAQVEQDYRERCRVQHRQAQQQAAHARAALPAWPTPSRELDEMSGCDAWPEMTRVDGELAKELMAVVTKVIRSMGRRKAMQVAGCALAAVGLSGLDADECTRVAQALEAPHRVDAHVVENLAITLAQCKRLEDTLGPCEVLDTVVAQHGLVRRLAEGGCPDNLVKPLKLVESNAASAIGGYLIDMGRPEAAKGYFARARKAGHHAGNPACAAYAAANASFAAFLRGDTPTALDTAAAARSLAARTTDPRLKALAEQMAAAAYALDGQYRPSMAACARAQEFLASSSVVAPESLAYWVHEGTLDSQRSLFLCLLGKPREAVDAASNAKARFDRTYVGGYGHCQVRLGHALVLSKEITEATRVLGDAASQASLSPRLTAELHTARVLMQPWEHSPAVKALDAQLESCGLLPAMTSRPRTLTITAT